MIRNRPAAFFAGRTLLVAFEPILSTGAMFRAMQPDFGNRRLRQLQDRLGIREGAQEQKTKLESTLKGAPSVRTF